MIAHHEGECHNDLVAHVLNRLMRTAGIVAYWVLPNEDRDEMQRLEAETNRHLQLPGLRIVNQGINNVLQREHVLMIAHSPDLRHPPGPIIVICDEEYHIVGNEVWEHSEIERLSKDPSAIFLGRNLVLSRDALIRTRRKHLELVYKALPFPELDEIAGITDVVSVTITFPVHSLFARKAGWDPNDPNFGTVLIGFNESGRANRRD